MSDWNDDITGGYDDGIDEGPDENDADLLDENRIELVPCPHCGAMVSEYAQQCPACGDWIVSGSSKSPLSGSRPLWWIILAVGGIIMFVILYTIF